MAAVRLLRLRPVAIHLMRMNTDTAPAAKNRAIAEAVATERITECGCSSSFLLVLGSPWRASASFANEKPLSAPSLCWCNGQFVQLSLLPRPASNWPVTNYNPFPRISRVVPLLRVLSAQETKEASRASASAPIRILARTTPCQGGGVPPYGR